MSDPTNKSEVELVAIMRADCLVQDRRRDARALKDLEAENVTVPSRHQRRPPWIQEAAAKPTLRRPCSAFSLAQKCLGNLPRKPPLAVRDVAEPETDKW